jgi:hypothetical protein
MPTKGRKPRDVGRTFASLYETFISLKQAEGCRERTIKDYRDTLRDFSRFFDVNLVITNPKLYDALIFFCNQTGQTKYKAWQKRLNQKIISMHYLLFIVKGPGSISQGPFILPIPV